MTLEDAHEFSWDEILEQATEYISTFAWALDNWKNSSEDIPHDYLFVLILANRARSKSASAVLRSDMPDALINLRDKLISNLREAEQKFQEFIKEERETLETILADQFALRIKELDNLIKRTITSVQDKNSFESDEDESREIAHDFIIGFEDMYLCNRELGSSSLVKLLDSNKFREEFIRVEQNFKKNFNYFYVIKDILLTIKKREYSLDAWWLDKEPQKSYLPDEEFSLEQQEILKNIFSNESVDYLGECQEVEKVIAYAQRDLDLKEYASVREHLTSCQSCLDIYFELRNPEKTVQDFSVAGIPFTPKLAEAIRESIGEKATKPSIGKKMKEFLESIIAPRYFPQFATAVMICLVVAVFSIYYRTNKSVDFQITPDIARVHVDLHLYGQNKQLTRGEENVFSNSFELNSGDTLYSGDRFAIQLKVDQNSYVYVLLYDNQGGISLLSSEEVPADQTVVFPKEDEMFQLDNQTGLETYYFVIKKEPSEHIDKLISRLEHEGINNIDKVFDAATIRSFQIRHK